MANTESTYDRAGTAGSSTLDLAQMRPEGFLKRMRDSEDQIIAKVERGAGWRANPVCLVCSSSKREPLWTAHGIQLFACLDCDHRYFEKMPRDLSEVYEGEDYLEKSKTSYLTNVDYRLMRFAAERLALLNLQKPFSPNQSVLDIGCGTGWFLHAAKEAGYQSYGFEFSSSLARYTASTVGCTVYDSSLEAIDAKFDIVTLFDVIEHVPDPAATFKLVRKLLKPGGVTLVFSPNFASVAISAQQADSNLVMPTRHLSYFTKSSVEKLCEVSGMNLLWFRTAGIDIGDLMAWYEGRGMKRDLDTWQNLSNTLQPAIDSLGVGNHLRFMASPA